MKTNAGLRKLLNGLGRVPLVRFASLRFFKAGGALYPLCGDFH